MDKNMEKFSATLDEAGKMMQIQHEKLIEEK